MTLHPDELINLGENEYRCGTDCPAYHSKNSVCQTNLRAPFYVKEGDLCLVVSVRKKLEQLAQSADKAEEHPFSEWGKAPLPFQSQKKQNF